MSCNSTTCGMLPHLPLISSTGPNNNATNATGDYFTATSYDPTYLVEQSVYISIHSVLFIYFVLLLINNRYLVQYLGPAALNKMKIAFQLIGFICCILAFISSVDMYDIYNIMPPATATYTTITIVAFQLLAAMIIIHNTIATQYALNNLRQPLYLKCGFFLLNISNFIVTLALSALTNIYEQRRYYIVNYIYLGVVFLLIDIAMNIAIFSVTRAIAKFLRKSAENHADNISVNKKPKKNNYMIASENHSLTLKPSNCGDPNSPNYVHGCDSDQSKSRFSSAPMISGSGTPSKAAKPHSSVVSYKQMRELHLLCLACNFALLLGTVIVFSTAFDELSSGKWDAPKGQSDPANFSIDFANWIEVVVEIVIAWCAYKPFYLFLPFTACHSVPFVKRLSKQVMPLDSYTQNTQTLTHSREYQLKTMKERQILSQVQSNQDRANHEQYRIIINPANQALQDNMNQEDHPVNAPAVALSTNDGESCMGDSVCLSSLPQPEPIMDEFELLHQQFVAIQAAQLSFNAGEREDSFPELKINSHALDL
jgi:hypothetical protein